MLMLYHMQKTKTKLNEREREKHVNDENVEILHV